MFEFQPGCVVRVPHATLQRVLDEQQPPLFLADHSKAAFGRVRRVPRAGSMALAVVSLAKARTFAEEDAQAFSRAQQHPDNLLARLVAFACPRSEAAAEEEAEDESKGGGAGGGIAAAGAPPPLPPLPGPSLVFELPRCGSLAEVLADDGAAAQLPWRARMRVAQQVAAALHFLHGGDSDGAPPRYHRDVKSANVLLGSYTGLQTQLLGAGLAALLQPDGAAVGPDGVARVARSTMRAPFGSPGYMCPTYAGTTRVFDRSAEVYSLGVLLAELLTGRCYAGGHGDPDEDLADGELDEARAGVWPADEARAQMVELARRCLKSKVKKRATLPEVLGGLNALCEKHCGVSAFERDLERQRAAKAEAWQQKFTLMRDVSSRRSFPRCAVSC